MRKRLWRQELHSKGHATFFRSLGAVLGYVPPKGSLVDKSNKRNYKFSDRDQDKIIRWIEDNLLINFVEYEGDIPGVETYLIHKIGPKWNLTRNNPAPSMLVKGLRDNCVRIALETDE